MQEPDWYSKQYTGAQETHSSVSKITKMTFTKYIFFKVISIRRKHTNNAQCNTGGFG